MDADKALPITIISPVFLFLLLLNLLAPGGSWLRTEIARLGAVPIAPILVVNIVVVLAGLLLIQQFPQMNREQRSTTIMVTPFIASLIIIDLCIEYASIFDTPYILFGLLLVPLCSWLYFANLHAFQKNLISVPANVLMNIRSLFLGNRSIRGTKRILPLSHLESVSQKIPLADQETDFDINDIGTRDARKVNVTISVCYAVMDRDGQKAEQEWSKIMSIPSRSSKFNQASRELELGADFMSKPEFWEKLYENLVKEEGTKIVRGMIYDNLDKLFIGNPVCPTFTHNVHARFRDLFESWGLDIKEVQFVNVDTVDEHMQGYGHVAQRERDTREHQIRLQVEAIDRIAEARANGIKRLESARAEAHANALEQMVSRVISVIKTEQGGHIAPEQVEAVVRSTLDELMLIRRLESGSNQRVDPMEHVGSNNN